MFGNNFGGQPNPFMEGYMAGYNAGYMAATGGLGPGQVPVQEDTPPAPKKKRASAYNRRYKAAFKKVAPRYKLKSGKWKAGGFKRAVKEAHKVAGGKRK